MIATNHHARHYLHRSEVPQRVLDQDFDWLDEEDSHDGFIFYRRRWYHLSEFMRAPDDLDWHGVHSDSAFFFERARIYRSAVAIRVSDDGETYKIATVTT